MKEHTFHATLQARGPKGAWTHLQVPFSVEAVFGSRAMVPVTGTINGFRFRTSLMPQGDGSHSITVTRAMMAGANAKPPDSVLVTLALDTEPRTVALPEDLLALLDATGKATLERLSYSHRKEYADWITSAKRPETRHRRLEKAAALLAQGKLLAD